MESACTQSGAGIYPAAKLVRPTPPPGGGRFFRAVRRMRTAVVGLSAKLLMAPRVVPERSLYPAAQIVRIRLTTRSLERCRSGLTGPLGRRVNLARGSVGSNPTLSANHGERTQPTRAGLPCPACIFKWWGAGAV